MKLVHKVHISEKELNMGKVISTALTALGETPKDTAVTDSASTVSTGRVLTGRGMAGTNIMPPGWIGPVIAGNTTRSTSDNCGNALMKPISSCSAANSDMPYMTQGLSWRMLSA